MKAREISEPQTDGKPQINNVVVGTPRLASITKRHIGQNSW